MANYHKDNISLSDAMALDIKQSFRTWRATGIHIPFKCLPSNATNVGTVVAKSPEGNISTHICFTIPKESPFSIITVSTFSSLTELKANHPQLFELRGHLFAIG